MSRGLNESKNAPGGSLKKLPGALRLCAAAPCTRCLCSCLGCTGAELISLVMVWLPPRTFSFCSFHSPAFGSRQLGSSQRSLLGRGAAVEGFGMALLHVFFSCGDGIRMSKGSQMLRWYQRCWVSLCDLGHPAAGFT